MTVNTPEDADHILDTINSYADVCATLHELLDIIGQNPQLFQAQIDRACGMIVQMNCQPHSACSGGES